MPAPCSVGDQLLEGHHGDLKADVGGGVQLCDRARQPRKRGIAISIHIEPSGGELIVNQMHRLDRDLDAVSMGHGAVVNDPHLCGPVFGGCGERKPARVGQVVDDVDRDVSTAAISQQLPMTAMHR